MQIYANVLTFKEPTAAEVPLNEELAVLIRTHHLKTREHLFHLCMLAYGLRRNNLISNRGKRGGNAQGKELKPEFKLWYETHNLEEIYGKESNFIKYAMSGRLLNYVAWQIGKKYIEQLPSSLTALYACSQLLWQQGDTTTDLKRKQFYDLLNKRIKDGSSVDKTKINKQSTRSDIEKLLNQSNLNSKTPKPQSVLKNKSIELMKILVSNDIYKFTNTHTKRGFLKIEEVNKLQAEIDKLIKRFNKNRKFFSVKSSFEEIKEKYQKEENTDFGAAILSNQNKHKAVIKTVGKKKVITKNSATKKSSK